jgi:hypothetical protein
MKNKPFYEILTYDDPLQRQKWQEICNSFDNVDIFYYPEYSRLFELHGDGKPHFFIYHIPPDSLVIYPFLKRPLNELIKYKNINKNLFDITSPYGYNGYLRNNSSIDMEKFYNCFHSYCIDNNIVSEFIRFHPLLNNVSYSPAQVKILQERETIVIDLSQTNEKIWSSFQPSCRNKIRKAQKNNITISKDDDFSNFEIFYELYNETMNRLNATDYYFFAKGWFYSLIDLMKENIVLFHAYHAQEVINSAIFIFNSNYINYYLSGSLFQMRNLAANNLLLYEVALWAKSKGIKYFHLGGGYQPNDSLSHFKSSFSPYKTKFYIGGVIHQPANYKYLCDLRLQENELQSESNFFPLYRLPQEF